jgi:restriction system protein
MAEITAKRVGELQRGVFTILLNQPEGLAAKEVLQKMEQVVPPTNFEKTDYPNNPGVRRFEKMIRFATIAPVKAGWLVKDKGKWWLTKDGRRHLRSTLTLRSSGVRERDFITSGAVPTGCSSENSW